MNPNGSSPAPVSFDDLTMGDMIQIEEVLGFDLSSAGPIKSATAIAWAIRHRTDPEFSWEDALRLKPAELGVGDTDPEVPSDDGGTAPPSSPASGDSIPNASSTIRSG